MSAAWAALYTKEGVRPFACVCVCPLIDARVHATQHAMRNLCRTCAWLYRDQKGPNGAKEGAHLWKATTITFSGAPRASRRGRERRRSAKEPEARQSNFGSSLSSSSSSSLDACKTKGTGMGGRRMRGRGRHMWSEGAFFWAFDARPSRIADLR